MAITPRQMLVPSSKYSIKCPYAMSADYITVHNTANDATANNEISYMRNNNLQVSYHFAVDDTEVVQGVPLNRNAWHAGDGANGTGNRRSIGIEICWSKSGGDRFIRAEQLAAKFIAQLLKERNWGLDRVRTHQSWSGKYCPHRTLDMGWDRYKNMIQAELNALNAPAITYKDEWHAKMVTNKATRLVSLPDMKTVKTYAKGEIIDEIAQVCAYNGVKYYRSKWSKDRNINNVLPVADLDDYVAPKPKPTWIDVKTVQMVAIVDCHLYDLNTGAVVKTYKKGDRFDFVQYAEWNGKRYYRTQYSKDKNLDRGIPANELEPYTVPAPKPPVEPGKPVEPEKPTTPTTPEQPQGWWASFVETLKNSIYNFFANLFNKEK